jgi:hypothetical protein
VSDKVGVTCWADEEDAAQKVSEGLALAWASMETPSLHLAVVCLGNPGIVADSFGPWVGSGLEGFCRLRGIALYGTATQPLVDMEHICERAFLLKKEAVTALVVDAAVRKGQRAGLLWAGSGPVVPSLALGEGVVRFGELAVIASVGSRPLEADMVVVHQCISVAEEGIRRFLEKLSPQ